MLSYAPGEITHVMLLKTFINYSKPKNFKFRSIPNNMSHIILNLIFNFCCLLYISFESPDYFKTLFFEFDLTLLENLLILGEKLYLEKVENLLSVSHARNQKFIEGDFCKLAFGTDTAKITYLHK